MTQSGESKICERNRLLYILRSKNWLALVQSIHFRTLLIDMTTNAQLKRL